MAKNKPYAQTVALPGVLGGGSDLQSLILGTRHSALIQYLPLLETSGTTAEDRTGYGHNGAYAGTGVSVGGGTFIDGSACLAVGSGGYVNLYSASLNSTWDRDLYTALIFVRDSSGALWGDGTDRALWSLFAPGNNYARLFADDTSAHIRAWHTGAAVQADAKRGVKSDQWLCVAMTANRASDRVRIYVNGILVEEVGSLAQITGDLAATTCTIGAINTLANWHFDNGQFVHYALWNAELTPTEIKRIVDGAFAPRVLICLGVSKNANNLWCGFVSDDAMAAPPPYYAVSTHLSQSGDDTSELLARVTADIDDVVYTPTYAIIGVGTNDLASLPVEATFKANYTAIIDALRTKWANIVVFCTRVWNSAQSANSDTLDGWINDVVATYSARVFRGMDERHVTKFTDDGVTYTTDGTHYNPAGQVRVENFQRAMMSYYDVFDTAGQSHVIGFWPLNEATGTAGEEISGKAGAATLANITWNVTGSGDGATGVALDGSTSSIDIHSAALVSAFDPDVGTLIVWAHSDNWARLAYETIIDLRADNVNRIQIYKGDGGAKINAIWYAGGDTSVLLSNLSFTPSSTQPVPIIMIWDRANNRSELWFNGTLVDSAGAPGSVWSGALAQATVGIRGQLNDRILDGTVARVAILDVAVTQAQIATLSTVRIP